MSILRTIKCDVEGCDFQYTENIDGGGFPGWGHIKGLQFINKDGSIQDIAYICPVCLERLKVFLNGKEG